MEHDKVYTICENMCLEESLTKPQIEETVDTQVRGYGVPVNSVMGFDGNVSDMPAGFELSDEPIGGGNPIGTVLEYAGVTAPSGYLLCNGAAVSRTEYDALFNVIGTLFGEGDGSTTFNLPNRSGKMGVGYNSSDSDFNVIGKTGGEKTHTLTVDEMPSHNHTISNNGSTNLPITINAPTGGTGYNIGYEYGARSEPRLIADNKGGSKAHNNMPPFVVMNYIIKY